MHNFSDDAILMVLASEHYDSSDYIFIPYRPLDELLAPTVMTRRIRA